MAKHYPHHARPSREGWLQLEYLGGPLYEVINKKMLLSENVVKFVRPFQI